MAEVRGIAVPRGIARGLDSIAGLRVMDLPAGKAVLFIAGLGVADILTSAGATMFRLPAIAWGAGGAYAARNVRFVRNFLGDYGSEVMAIAMIAAPVDDMFALREKTGMLLGKVLKPAGLTPVAATPVKMVKTKEWLGLPEEKKALIVPPPAPPAVTEAEELVRRHRKGAI